MDFLRSTVGAGVVLIKDNQILLVKPNYGKGKGHWILPGGMLEPGETPQSAAERETLEETGVDCEVESPVAVRFRQKDHGEPNTYWVFVARASGELETLKEQIKWPEDELLDAAFVPVSEALDGDATRPMTQLFIRTALGREDGIEQMAWMNEGNDCVFRFA